MDRGSEVSKRPSYVYLIEGAGLIKIGTAYNPERRMAEMQTGSPVPLTLLAKTSGNYQTEDRLHKRFSQWCTAGEWFDLEPDVLAQLIEEFGGRVVERERCIVCEEVFVTGTGRGHTCGEACGKAYSRRMGLPY